MPEPVAVVSTTSADTPAVSTVSKSIPSHIEPESVIGFSGHVNGGLLQHPDGQHMMYPLGSTVVISKKDSFLAGTKSGKQQFLYGHSDVITALTISRDGRYIASGQKTHQGFQADIIVWEWATKKQLHKFSLHKVSVKSLTFSSDGQYLVSLGDQDDNYLAVWDIERGAAVAGSPASKDISAQPNTVVCFSKANNKFVTAGAGPIRIWHFDPKAKKISCKDCQLGQIKRVVKSAAISPDDQWAYCGTTTGDVLQISLEHALLSRFGPQKNKDNLSMGVTTITVSNKRDLLYVGSGDGTVALMDRTKLAFLKKCSIRGGVTNLVESPEGVLFATTTDSNVYTITNLDAFSPKLVMSSHYTKINDICFPSNCSDLFATASDSDVRIWNLNSHQELLRISVPNVKCNSVIFRKDGSSLITGWEDGKIRSFGPETGRLQFTIHDAHRDGVTCLAITESVNGEYRIVSGGVDGQVRVWRATKDFQSLALTMKEHKETVSCVFLKKNGKECISSSQDGSCIIWDLVRGVRNQVMFSPTFFMCCSYFPDESQLVTCGTDRKVAYWEVFDGTLIRELEAAEYDPINGMGITADGVYFVIGSDKLIKFYRYEEGDVVSTGKGHSTEITKLRLSPDQKTVVSVSVDGAIFIWKTPVRVGPAL